MIETKSKRIGSKSLKTFITLIALNTWSSLDNIQKLWENQSSQSNKVSVLRIFKEIDY